MTNLMTTRPSLWSLPVSTLWYTSK